MRRKYLLTHTIVPQETAMSVRPARAPRNGGQTRLSTSPC
jgi:hypothetical protein